MRMVVLLIAASFRLQAAGNIEAKLNKECPNEHLAQSSLYPEACNIEHLHAIHVSVSEINYSEKDKALQITSRIFIDDLELAIRSRLNNPELDILHPDKGQTTDQLVSAYLADHLKFKLDNKPVKIHYLAHEIEDVAMICYIEIEGVKKFKTLEVTNNVIQEIHNDQSNLVHITYKGPVKSFRLMKDKPTDIFKVETK
jgi:hypothetical protein